MNNLATARGGEARLGWARDAALLERRALARRGPRMGANLRWAPASAGRAALLLLRGPCCPRPADAPLVAAVVAVRRVLFCCHSAAPRPASMASTRLRLLEMSGERRCFYSDKHGQGDHVANWHLIDFFSPVNLIVGDILLLKVAHLVLHDPGPAVVAEHEP